MNTTPVELFHQAAALGLRLEPRGEMLAVIPADRVPADFAVVLREHKYELLAWLETRDVHLLSDCVPWLHTARQILAGEFDDADVTTRESLSTGVRGIKHPICSKALYHLWPKGVPERHKR